VQDVIPEVIPEVVQDVIPEVIPEVVQDVIPCRRNVTGGDASVVKCVMLFGFRRKDEADIDKVAEAARKADNAARDTYRIITMETVSDVIVYNVSKSKIDNNHTRSLCCDITSRKFLVELIRFLGGAVMTAIVIDHFWLPRSLVWARQGYFHGYLLSNFCGMVDENILGLGGIVYVPFNNAAVEWLVKETDSRERLKKLKQYYHVQPVQCMLENPLVRSDSAVTEQLRCMHKIPEGQFKLLGLERSDKHLAVLKGRGLLEHATWETKFIKLVRR